MNIRCLIGGHGWRLAEPWTNAGWIMPGSARPVWGMCHSLDGTVYAGFDLRVECYDCGARAMAEFRSRDEWVKGVDTGWQLHVKHWRGGLVSDAPPSDHVDAAIRGLAIPA